MRLTAADLEALRRARPELVEQLVVPNVPDRRAGSGAANAELLNIVRTALRVPALRGQQIRAVTEYPVVLPNPASRRGVSRYRIDVAIPARKIGIEMDGFRYHARFPKSFRAHTLRQNALIVGGWRLLRYTRGMLADPDRIMEDLRQLL